MFKSMVNVLVAITFLFSNCVWAGGLPASKLAAQSVAGGVLPEVRALYAGDAALRALLRQGVLSNADILGGLDKLKADFMQVPGIDEADKEKVRWLVFSDKGDTNQRAYYAFFPGGIFIRGTTASDVDDPFFEVIKEIACLMQEVGPSNIGGEVLFRKVYKVENAEFIKAVISELYETEEAPRSVPPEIKSHLFPKHLHDAIKTGLDAAGTDAVKVLKILTKGAAYYDSEAGNIVEEANENEFGIIADVLTQELKVKKQKIGVITADDVRSVLRLHEELEKRITKIDFSQLLERMKEYCNNKKPEKLDYDKYLKDLLDGFCRNYAYERSRSDLELIRELLVHAFVERHIFKQPVRLIDAGGNKVPISPELEQLLLGQVAGLFSGLLSLTPEETVDIFAGILNLNNEERDYFLILYRLYLNPISVDLRIGGDFEHGENFIPSAMMSASDRQSKLGGVEYKDLLMERELYEEKAKEVRLILNPMDGGKGDAVKRRRYMLKRKEPTSADRYDFWTRDESLERLIPRLGAKSSDLYIPCLSGDISIMEAKLRRAVIEAANGWYASIEYQMLGDPETKFSLERILAGIGTGISPVEVGTPSVVLGINAPAVSAVGRHLTTENMGHGNHGSRGVYFLLKMIREEFRKGKETLIRAIYNGDGINNGVDPVIVGWMAEEKVPMVMMTTTKTGLDKKGGQIGIQILKDGGYKVQIMELAQAKSAGQERLFYDIGLEGRPGDEVGNQYFNTNTVLMNLSVLTPFLQDLFNAIGEEKFIEAISPDLIKNEKEQGEKRFTQLEGALGSVVLNLAAYIDAQEDQEKRALIEALKERHGIKKFLRIVNIDEDNRNRFFTPFKNSNDYWFFFHSGRFSLDPNTMELVDNCPDKPLPRFDLMHSFYSDVQNLMDAFTGADISELELLEVQEAPVILRNAVLKGRVRIANRYNNPRGRVRPIDRYKVLPRNLLVLDGKILQDVSIEVLCQSVKLEGFRLEGRVGIVNISEKEKEVVDLYAYKDVLMNKFGIKEEDEELVLKNVCILVDDNGLYAFSLNEDDENLGSRVLSRQIYRLMDENEIVPEILEKAVVLVYDIEMQTISLKHIPDIDTEIKAGRYAKPVTEENKFPKYGRDGKARFFDGVTMVTNIPDGTNLKTLFRELVDGLYSLQKFIMQRNIIAPVPVGTERLTLCQGVAIDDWKSKYENELNAETKKEIEERKIVLVQYKMTDGDEALKQAVYEVVAERIVRVLKDFSVSKRPVFRPYRIAAFPADYSDEGMGKRVLALAMTPATAEDLAIVTKMRDAIKSATGITSFGDFKAYVSFGYFIDRFEKLEKYRDFKNFITKLNDKVLAVRDNEDFQLELGSIDVSFFTDMEAFSTVRSFSWVDRHHNSTTGTIVGKELIRQIRALQTTRMPKAAPVAKKARIGGREVDIGTLLIYSLPPDEEPDESWVPGVWFSEGSTENIKKVEILTVSGGKIHIVSERKSGQRLLYDFSGAVADERETYETKINDLPIPKIFGDEISRVVSSDTFLLKDGREVRIYVQSGKEIYADIAYAGPLSGPIGKTSGEVVPVDLWQGDVTTDGKIENGAVITAEHPKTGKVKVDVLQSVLEKLNERYGPGIFAVVDAVRVVDNISDGSPGVSPYAMLIEEYGKNILLLDADVFDDEELLYIVLEHELRESIMIIVPCENEAVRELTTNFMSLKLALEKGIKVDRAKLQELGADLQFFEALEVLQAMGEVTDEDIIAVAIEHMRGMPYYAELFGIFSFAEEWRDKIKGAENRYRAALQVFNDIAGAKEMAGKVKKTGVRLDRKIIDLGAVIKKMKMLTSVWSVNAGFVDALLQGKKFVRLDVDELAKQENRYIVDWLKNVTEGKDKSPFVFYSGEKGDVGRFLEENALKQGELTQGIRAEDVITLLDLGNKKPGMPLIRATEAALDNLYLPLIYSINGIYLAGQVVLSGGDINGIQDMLAKNTLQAVYETLFGRELTEDEWTALFRGRLWPPVERITEAINALRKAIAQIEAAA